MHRKSLNPFWVATLAAFIATTYPSANAVESGKKMLVYILAGQSNAQGHAEVSTLAYLPKPAHLPTKEEWAIMTAGLEREMKRKTEGTLREDLLKDPENAKLPKNEFGALLEKTFKAQVERVRSERYEEFLKRQADPARAARDKGLATIFTSHLTDQKVRDTIASAKALKNPPDVADEWQKNLSLPVGKRTHIAAYGGVKRGIKEGEATGPLSTGYGARPTAFGPEYAFGIMMERALDQPVLIIKTAWGGKSLHYDFRPPSAGPYQPTAGEKEQLANWKTKKAKWDAYIAGGGTAQAAEQMGKEIKAIDQQKRDLQAAMVQRPKDQQAAEREKIAALDAKSKELSKQFVPAPGEMPRRDQAGFYWNEMIGYVRKVLADPKAYHPDYDPKAGFEVAGALWFQGFNDQFDPEYYGNYSSNMVHFIQDLRKEVKQPQMPFVIGVLGTAAFPEGALANNVALAQREAARAPELAGHVAAIESWPLTTPEVGIWRSTPDWPLYGSNQGYHYDGSGRFFIRLGDEFATAMLKLMDKK